ncbi:MAG TPA: hypothetical protein VFW73_11540 [Lacipirellulaceae bacterium]|nr:hypothetical protein [Lacipirellulaceae bacterium]
MRRIHSQLGSLITRHLERFAFICSRPLLGRIERETSGVTDPGCNNSTAALQMRSAIDRVRTFAPACFAIIVLSSVSTCALAAPCVEFDIAPTAECRDITPPQRMTQYPNERLIQVALPISVRFRGVSMGDVDELAIEVNGAAAGLRVEYFSPMTQLVSDVSHDIETTTTTTKGHTLDGSLGGTFPIPGADVVAHLTPTISAALTNCDTSTEKINRLPPKHAVVVSGTSREGRGVFFKLKPYSQTSLEGVHDLSVTFVAPRYWQGSEIRVDCAARGERKMLWMKQTGIIGQTSRTVQLVRMSAKPLRQLVLKPTDDPQPTTTSATCTATSTKSAPAWRPAAPTMGSAKVSANGNNKQASKSKVGAKPITKSEN